MTTQAEHTTGTSHAGLAAWVDEVAALTTPDAIHWVDGSDEEWDLLTTRARRGRHLHPAQPGQEAEQLLRGLRPHRRRPRRGPHLHLLRGREGRRLHQQLEVAGRDEGPDDRPLPGLHDRSHDVRHPVRHGPHRGRRADVRRRDHRLRLRRGLDEDHGPHRHPGARAPSRSRTPASSRACTRSASRSPTARPTSPGRAARPSTSPTSPRRARSGATAPATAATPCSARSATRCASPRRWPATRAGWPSTCSSSSSPRPTGSVHYIAGAFPSACGKTNLAMIEPTLDGLEGRDGRRRHRLDALRRRTAGCMPSTPSSACSASRPAPACTTNPNAMRTVEKGNSIFTNVALTDDGDVWWEGMTEEKPAHLTDWKGNDWTPESGVPLQPPEQPLLHPGQAVPDDGARVRRAQRRADRRDPLRRPPQDHRAARLRVARLGPRRLHRRDALLGDHRRGHRCGRRRAPRPDGDAALHRLQRRRLRQPLARDRQERTTSPSCRRSSRSTGSAATTRTAPSCGPASATTPACSSGSSSASTAPPRPSRPRSASCPPPGALDTTGLDMSRGAGRQGPRRQRRRVARQGAAPHPGVVRQVRRHPPHPAGRRARHPQGPARERLTVRPAARATNPWRAVLPGGSSRPTSLSGCRVRALRTDLTPRGRWSARSPPDDGEHGHRHEGLATCRGGHRPVTSASRSASVITTPASTAAGPAIGEHPALAQGVVGQHQGARPDVRVDHQPGRLQLTAQQPPGERVRPLGQREGAVALEHVGVRGMGDGGRPVRVEERHPSTRAQDAGELADRGIRRRRRAAGPARRRPRRPRRRRRQCVGRAVDEHGGRARGLRPTSGDLRRAGLGSTPVAEPLGPTLAARRTVLAPVPAPTSTATSPGRDGESLESPVPQPDHARLRRLDVEQHRQPLGLGVTTHPDLGVAEPTRRRPLTRLSVIRRV